MVKENLSLQLPRLEEFVELDPLTVSLETLVIDAIAQMNQPEKMNFPGKPARNQTCYSYILIVQSNHSPRSFSPQEPRQSIQPISNSCLRLAGILTERDIVKLAASSTDLSKTIVQDVMTRNVVALKKNDFVDVYHVNSILRQHQIRHLPIVDESGELQGIITEHTLLRVLNHTKPYKIISTLNQELNQQAKDLQAEVEQRQQIAIKLQEQQQQLETLVRHAPVAISMVDQEMRYLIVSDRWIEDHKLETKDIIGLTHYEVFPETPQHWRQNCQDCLTGKVKSLRSEADNSDDFVRLDSGVELQSWEIYPWQNVTGQIGGLLMFAEMLTEKKLLKQRLQSSEAQMRAIFEAMTDLVLTVDVTNDSIQILPTKSVHCNNASSYNPIIEQTYAQLFDGDQASYYQDLIRQVLHTPQTIDFEYSLKLNNSTVWFNVSISSVSEHVVIWVARNITQRKRMEQKLFAEKELAQVTLKSIGDAVITTDALGKVRYVNPVAERLIGWQAAAARGKNLTEVFEIINQFTREPVANPVDIAIKENRICELANDTLLLARDGTELAIEDSAAPILNRQGELIGAVIVFHDVTQARNLAQELSWQATHDSLTGLYNRRQFERHVDTAIKNSQDSDSNHALCYLDLDQFKIINDTCGHAAGDELLCQVTQLLQKRIRTLDIFARLGGDEFGLLLHQCSTEMAKEIANQLRELVQNFRFIWDDQVFSIGVSIGIVAVDSNTKNRGRVLNRADTACYTAKRKGRNCIHFIHEPDIKASKISGQRGESK